MRQPSQCPSCGLIMSFREEDEQGQCNECTPYLADFRFWPEYDDDDSYSEFAFEDGE